MNKRDKQYHDFFKGMGFEFVYHPDKSGFSIKGVGYAKVCDFPAKEAIVNLAEKASEKQYIILLEGNLTFKTYKVFYKGKFQSDYIFVHKGNKHHPLFFENYYPLEYFPESDLELSKAINGSIACTRCGSVDDYKIEKPSIHYKATCNGCGSFIKNIGTNEPAVLYFGKYKGREVSSMRSNEELQYLQWLLGSSEKLKGKLLDAIKYQLSL